MDTRLRHGLLSAALAMGLGLAQPAQALTADSLPPGVTRDMVAKGKGIFGGAGLCLACHGADGKGVIGPNLTDKTWLHGDGSYDAIVKQIISGVDEKASKTGQVMPPRGGSGISDAEVRAVAAYVWTLSHGAGK
jgi:mono/diheme cytochrome c family protein